MKSAEKRGRSAPWHWKPVWNLSNRPSVNVSDKWRLARDIAKPATFMSGYVILYSSTIEAAQYLNGIKKK